MNNEWLVLGCICVVFFINQFFFVKINLQCKAWSAMQEKKKQTIFFVILKKPKRSMTKFTWLMVLALDDN